jgi:hypothetical protein
MHGSLLLHAFYTGPFNRGFIKSFDYEALLAFIIRVLLLSMASGFDPQFISQL